MKKLLMMCIALMAVVFGGCSATGEVVVDVAGTKSKRLSKVHEVASSYDEVRTTVRDLEKEYDENQDYFDNNQFGSDDRVRILRQEELSEKLDTYTLQQMKNNE